ncbi:MAG TPA: ABC transporter permease [Aggregatilinea sp.]|jgi:peptide/nickel transport system permease protein|uniref:ABC transporter permease n=1 Tax=Aggregatilinea sp. TaxID=2806333 RepID=UPI002BBEECE1|nr:ABC transporter permease [Aggregatilinea sp.]HML20560.1 ABC transporter permease [Aggregatilinea sp.]
MIAFIVRRLLAMIPMLIAISFISFAIIQLPPGDYLSTLQAVQGTSGGGMSNEQAQLLRERYGLDESFLTQYWKWVKGFPKGDLGYSYEWTSSVWPLIKDRIWYTLLLGACSILVMVVLSVPIGIYSATHQYSVGDTLMSIIAFLGLSVPGFLLALIWLYIGGVLLNLDVLGAQSKEYINTAFSWGKAWDYFLHLWPPAIILGLASTAQLMRIMRNGMLDEMNKQYITTARAKGLKERKVINKYAVRSALNPVVSVLAMEVPKIISSSILIGVVMSVPTTGPLFLRSLQSQDMYVAGAFLLIMSLMLLVSNLIADLLLAWLDPRIVYT